MSAYVHIMICRFNEDFLFATHYLSPKGWVKSPRTCYPILFKSIQEARTACKALKPYPRIRIWKSNSHTKQPLFHHIKGKQAYKGS